MIPENEKLYIENDIKSLEQLVKETEDKTLSPRQVAEHYLSCGSKDRNCDKCVIGERLHTKYYDESLCELLTLFSVTVTNDLMKRLLS